MRCDFDVVLTEVARIAPGITGIEDPKALDKLRAEQRELETEIEAGNWEDALAELADVAWCCGKAVLNDLMLAPQAIGTIATAERRCKVGETYALIAMRAKYELRATTGRKDKDAERVAILEAMK